MGKSLKETVFVGMSGGVDSSVTAYLLKKQGYNVVGVFMRSYNIDGCAERDAEDARRVAGKLEISFYVWDFEEEYKKKVVDYMVKGYKAGLTPNPDVMCNREIKFGLFLKKALSLGAKYVATGHYVRKVGQKLFEGKDPQKDQSYFLWALTSDEIKHCLFPIGDHLKSEIRNIAKKAGLSTAEKKDSQGICFLGQVSLVEFLSTYIPRKKGQIITPDGMVVGEHEGAHFVTVGQRHVGSMIRDKNRKGDTKPHYVVAKDVRKNTVTVAEGRGNELLFKKEIDLGEVNILRKSSLKEVWARVRYRQPLSKAKLSILGSKTRLEFIEPQQFVAEGQSAVWYSKDGEMLGGGVIVSSK